MAILVFYWYGFISTRNVYFFVLILTCGYKCEYNYLYLFINYSDISLLGMKFESGLPPLLIAYRYFTIPLIYN